MSSRELDPKSSFLDTFVLVFEHGSLNCEMYGS